jgi:hypothetical protein
MSKFTLSVMSKVLSSCLSRSRQPACGTSLTETLLTIGALSLVAAITVPAILDSGMLRERSKSGSVESATHDIVKAFQSEESEIGLIPRSMPPNEILQKRLNQLNSEEISNAGAIPTGCSAQVSLPAVAITLADNHRVAYAPMSWAVAGNGNDYADVCVISDGTASTKRFYRAGSTLGNHNSVNMANASMSGITGQSTNVTATNQTTGEATTISGLSSGSMDVQKVLSIRLLSRYSNQQLNLNSTVSIFCPRTGYTATGTGQVYAPVNQSCQLTLSNLNTPENGFPDSNYTPEQNTVNLFVRQDTANPTIRVRDSHKVKLSYISPFSNSGLNLSTPVQTRLNTTGDSFNVTSRLDREYMVPAGNYNLRVEGRDIVRRDLGINVTKPVTQTITLQHRWSANIAQVVSDTDASAGSVTNYLSWAQNMLQQAITGNASQQVIALRQQNLQAAMNIALMFGNTFVPQGQAMTLVDGVQRYVSTSMGLVDNQGNSTMVNASNQYASMQPHFGSDGRLYLVGANGIYVVDTRNSIIY